MSRFEQVVPVDDIQRFGPLFGEKDADIVILIVVSEYLVSHLLQAGLKAGARLQVVATARAPLAVGSFWYGMRL